MLLSLPSELIDIIIRYLNPRPIWSRVEGHSPFDPCSCLPKENLDRQLLLYNVSGKPPPKDPGLYETDVLRFGKGHPHLAQCVANGKWHVVVEMSRTVDLDVIGHVPGALRGMVRYVFPSSCWASVFLMPPV
jgi:hypothetical protein